MSFARRLCPSIFHSHQLNPTTSSKHISNRNKLLALFILLGIALLFVIFVFVWVRYRRATDALSESNLIGSGSFGSVYKGVLRSGTAIAVKVFNQQLDASFRSLETECEVLRSLRQRNLVKVITSCSNLDFKALVLEYMPNGSLERYLYSHNYFLDIMQRLRIMIDVACALEYLHHGCSLSVIHCDLKPRNVLLDEDMVAHLSDFGISKMLGDDKCDLYTKTLSTLGYIAPDLKQWVSYSLPEALIMDVIDANLLTSTGNCLQRELEVVASIKKLALDCCAESLARRTNMKNVVGMLQKTKIKLLECGECSSK
ncbi:receptor kinase-like protein Xa21 [Capsicum annuum]